MSEKKKNCREANPEVHWDHPEQGSEKKAEKKEEKHPQHQGSDKK